MTIPASMPNNQQPFLLHIDLLQFSGKIIYIGLGDIKERRLLWSESLLPYL